MLRYLETIEYCDTQKYVSVLCKILWDGQGLAIPASSATSKRLSSCSGNIMSHCNVVVPIRTSLEAQNCLGLSPQKHGIKHEISYQMHISNISRSRMWPWHQIHVSGVNVTQQRGSSLPVLYEKANFYAFLLPDHPYFPKAVETKKAVKIASNSIYFICLFPFNSGLQLSQFLLGATALNYRWADWGYSAAVRTGRPIWLEKSIFNYLSMFLYVKVTCTVPK